MATGLGQLLVDDGAVHPDRLEEAYQRQVLYGGQLDSVLLEMGLVDEPTLLEAMSRRCGMPAADRTALASVDPELVRRLPRRLAESYRVVPLKLDRRHLHVACCRPLALDVLDDISFTLSLYLVPHITTELRLQRALEQLYGVPMGARFEHLLAQLGEDRAADDDGAHQETAAAPTGAASLEPQAEPEAKAAPDDARATSQPTGWVVDEPARQQQAPAEAEVERRRDDPIETWHAVPASQAGIDLSGLRFERPAQAVSSLLTGGIVEVDTSLFEQAPARLVERLKAEDQALAERLARRQERVTWSQQDAAAELALARNRDDVVEVMLRYAHRRLERVAVFVLLDEAFIGWDALGGELEGRIARQRVPVATSPALHLVRRTGAASLGPLPVGDALLQALGGEAPRAVAIVPFFARERLLGVLVGDCGDAVINPTLLTELQVLMPEVRLALEVVILRRKREMASAAAADGLDADDAQPLETGAPSGEAVVADVAASTSELPPTPLLVQEPARPLAGTADVDDPAPMQPEARDGGGVEPAAVVVDEALLARTCEEEASALELARQLAQAPASASTVALVQQADAHEENEPARREALRCIEALRGAALPALLRAFPGRLRVNLFGNYDRRPGATALSGVCEALVRLGAAAASSVVVQALGSADRTQRIAAVVLAGELRMPAAQNRLCQCLLDPEARIAFTVAEVCTQHGRQPLPGWAAHHLEQALRATDPDELQRAVRASRACLHRASLHSLIQLLDKGPRELIDEVTDALREISKHDFGSSVSKWRHWFQEHGNERRVEWLLAGLAHRDKTLRQSAQFELTALSGEMFGYYYDSPKAERDAALERWRSWWEQARSRGDLP